MNSQDITTVIPNGPFVQEVCTFEQITPELPFSVDIHLLVMKTGHYR